MPEPPSWTRLAEADSVRLAKVVRITRDLARKSPNLEVIPSTGFSVRDEANALTAFAFRNGYIATPEPRASPTKR